jgi:hypothetical protein
MLIVWAALDGLAEATEADDSKSSDSSESPPEFDPLNLFSSCFNSRLSFPAALPKKRIIFNL